MWILLLESSVDNADSCLFDEVLFVGKNVKCYVVGDGWDIEEWQSFSICLADSVSPWDGGLSQFKS